VTAAESVQYAREFLDGARNRPVPTLPPSVMMRELAETRRQLGIVLQVIEDQAAALTAADLATVLDALAVAAEYRRYRPSLTCEACTVHPADLCEACATDLDRADEYDQLAGRIGGES
jgi:hypothetical protein